MRTKKVLRYYCDHKGCGKGHWKKTACIDHETICFYDPKNRACATCRHFEIDEEGLVCLHHGKYMSKYYPEAGEMKPAAKNCEFYGRK